MDERSVGVHGHAPGSAAGAAAKNDDRPAGGPTAEERAHIHAPLPEDTYTAIRDRYLNSELDRPSATILIGELELTAKQQREWTALTRLEAGLSELSAAAEQPWLRLRVETLIASREQARRWLAQHPRGLLGQSGLLLGPQEWRRSLTQALAVLGGGGLGWGTATLLVSLGHGGVAGGLSLPLLAAGGCALAAYGAVRWPDLRSSFTA